jgi:Sucrase/ferredoxin-like
VSGFRSTIPRGSLPPHPAGGPACSAASRLIGESLDASASPGTRWFLVEVAGAWGWSAFAESPVLDPAIGYALTRRAHASGVRIVAIRRPGRARGPVRWRWAIVESEPGAESVRWGEAKTPEELLTVPLDGSTGVPSDRPVIAVCTQGRHDECCAVRGRPVALRLAERYPDETWECSHIGGDRFAATMMLFPHALNYGRMDDLDPVDAVEQYRLGRIAPAGFRGRSTFPRIVQAAQSAAVERFGDRSVDAYRPVALHELPGGWLVDLAAESPLRVLVEGVQEGPLFTTCSASTAVRVAAFRSEVLAPGEPA